MKLCHAPPVYKNVGLNRCLEKHSADGLYLSGRRHSWDHGDEIGFVSSFGVKAGFDRTRLKPVFARNSGKASTLLVIACRASPPPFVVSGFQGPGGWARAQP
jgi:hypothetical protein